jgi:hypothetical protein
MTLHYSGLHLAGVAALLIGGLPARTAAAEVPPPQRADGGVTARAEQLLKQQSAEDLKEKITWAERIRLGDPHKYILPIIAAKLHFDPANKEALDAYRWIIEVDKAKIKNPGDRGLYHFSVIGKSRLFFGFEKTLPPDITGWFRENDGTFLDLYRAGGTENHQNMLRTSGYLFAERFQPTSQRTGDPKKDTLAFCRNFLRGECKKLYRVGQGEWDSSTYITFSAAGWVNVYDFAQDPEMRDIARAALDWYSVTYGLKSFHGLLSGPEARGFARAPVDTDTDVLAWLWFGGAPLGFTPDLTPTHGSVRYSIIAALSSYRPDPIVARLARKEVALPFAVRASKPEYYGAGRDNVYQEQGYYTENYAMGTLYDPTPGDKVVGEIWPQTTQFKLAVYLPEKQTTVVFGAANPYHRHFPVEGRSPFDQYHQARGAMVNVCHIPSSIDDARATASSLLAVPTLAGEPVTDNNWYLWQVGDTFVAARPLGTNTRFVTLADWSRRTGTQAKDGTVKVAEYPDFRWLQTDGQSCGWIIDTGTRKDYPTLTAFRDALRTRTKLDTTKLANRQQVTYTSLGGDVMTLRHTGRAVGKPDATTNGVPITYSGWPVYDSPYVQLPLRSGVLTVSDGTRRMIIDFSGDRPVWRYE